MDCKQGAISPISSSSKFRLGGSNLPSALPRGEAPFMAKIFALQHVQE